MLYFWQRLDENDLVSFSCAHIHKSLTATSSHHTTVGKNGKNKKKRQKDMSDSMEMVGQGIHVIASVEMQRQISELEEKKIQLEMRKLELDQEIRSSSQDLIDRRIKYLNDSISNFTNNKRTHDEMDDNANQIHIYY